MSAAQTTAPVAGAPKKSKKTLVIVIVVLIVAAAAGGGAWFFAMHQAEAKVKAAEAAAKKVALPAPAEYFAINPPFVVNLMGGAMDGSPQYMQVEVQLVARSPEDLKHIETHAPAIRARLLMLFSQQSAANISDVPGREKLQAAALLEVQNLLMKETGSKSAEQLLFTSFVTQ